MVGYEVRNFDEVEFQASTFKEYDLAGRDTRRYAKPPLQLEGKLTRIWYEAPGNTRALELYRNYASELAANGFAVLYDSSRTQRQGSGPTFSPASAAPAATSSGTTEANT